MCCVVVVFMIRNEVGAAKVINKGQKVIVGRKGHFSSRVSNHRYFLCQPYWGLRDSNFPHVVNNGGNGCNTVPFRYPRTALGNGRG